MAESPATSVTFGLRFPRIYQTRLLAFAGVDYRSDSRFLRRHVVGDVGAGTETDLYFGYNGGQRQRQIQDRLHRLSLLDDFDGDYDEIISSTLEFLPLQHRGRPVRRRQSTWEIR